MKIQLASDLHLEFLQRDLPDEDRWDVQRLDAKGQRVLRAAMDEEFWLTMTALPGVRDACFRLVGFVEWWLRSK